ncbi:hypothetical protein INR49_010743 [Caranx melampygus]|nr:hypothetical protein INR49_010743 [Caranx melampygus]
MVIQEDALDFIVGSLFTKSTGSRREDSGAPDRQAGRQRDNRGGCTAAAAARRRRRPQRAGLPDRNPRGLPECVVLLLLLWWL